jgi:hypothetical protein
VWLALADKASERPIRLTLAALVPKSPPSPTEVNFREAMNGARYR